MNITNQILVVGSLSLLATLLPARAEPNVTVLLKQLQSRNIETRYDAMRSLQTSLDPRIPEACLPVLQMEGNSIRRLAARAIGSRWHEIPKERVPAFTAALKTQLDGDHEGLRNMARRGIALLTRDYRNAMVSRSANKRWVIYERHGLPCLIDTGNNTEELLGFGTEAKLRAAYGNDEVAPVAIWHPKKEMVAMEIIEDRHHTTIWAWIHKKGLRQFHQQDVLKALGLEKQSGAVGIAFYLSFVGWKSNGLEFNALFSIKQGGEYIDNNAKLRWDPDQNRFTALPD
jgi:hypothetical protein